MAADLTPTDVRTMVEALGLTATDDDLVEVTHRLNAMRDALQALDALPLASAEPELPTP